MLARGSRIEETKIYGTDRIIPIYYTDLTLGIKRSDFWNIRAIFFIILRANTVGRFTLRVIIQTSHFLTSSIIIDLITQYETIRVWFPVSLFYSLDFTYR